VVEARRSSRDSVVSPTEGDKEGIAFVVDLVTVMALERLSKQPTMQG
jgi:hypothetical protein